MLSSQHIAPPFRTSVCEGFPVTSPACLETLFPLAFHAKIIRHREHVAHRVGVNPGLTLVALSGNHPLERDLAVIHDDVNRWNGLPVADGLARMAELSASRFASPEAQEGMAAFAEKREPRWVAELRAT